MNTSWIRKASSMLLLAALCVAAPAMAQLQSGNLYGAVTDEQGSPLPGVEVVLQGDSGSQSQMTDAQGRFRFLSLGPGSYSLRAALDGFSSIEYPTIAINVARNTEIELTMNAAVEDVITVTAESPLLDERRVSTGNTVARTELENIPTARDPWAVLQSTPGVLTDRINVGGNESGQQSQYVGPGSGGDQAVWSVDGVVITDMGALGSSPAYYDFDSFEEMQVTTGGSDASIGTGGVVLNMVTRRGTNEWRATGRYLVADDGLQSDDSFNEGQLSRSGSWNNNRTQPAFKAGNRIVRVEDYGFDIGGPLVRDRLWIWGAYAKPEIDLLTVSDVQDFTELETSNVKLNAQITPANSATVTALQSDKVKLGRNAGPTRSQPTTWNQSKFGDDPTAAKIEDTHVFNANFYATGLYSIVNGGFQLAPQGGLDVTPRRDNSLVWQHSFVLYQTQRPQEQLKVDGAAFFNVGSLSHELKFGAAYREAEVVSVSRWPGAGLAFGEPGDPYLYMILARPKNAISNNEYTSLYAQDTVSIGNLTANFGLRYDKQGGENLASSVEANPFTPDILPAVSFAGSDAGFEWGTITPRLGFTWALGQERKTLVRGSLSRFADQLGAAVLQATNPLYYQSYVYGYLYGNPGDGSFDRNGFVPNGGNSGSYNPVTRGLTLSNGVDPDFDAPTTDEVLLSLEHALLPEFVVGVNLTYRKYQDIIERERLVFDGNAFGPENLGHIGRVHRRSDYLQQSLTGTKPDGTPYTLRYWELRPGVSSRSGFFYENGDREQEYVGASLVATKRLANRWMMRGNISIHDWTWNVPDSENEDPTITLPNLNGAGIRDGDQVVQGSGTGSGAKGNVFIGSKWSYALNALYQVAPDRPWGFNVAANLTGRQGYPKIYFERFIRATLADGAGLGTPILVDSSIDAERYDDVHLLDLRLDKEFSFSDFGLTLSAELFNATNESYVLQRQGKLHRAGRPAGASNAGDHVQEIVSPRIFRVGARLSFR